MKAGVPETKPTVFATQDSIVTIRRLDPPKQSRNRKLAEIPCNPMSVVIVFFGYLNPSSLQLKRLRETCPWMPLVLFQMRSERVMLMVGLLPRPVGSHDWSMSNMPEEVVDPRVVGKGGVA
jgi:hypothetical protein